MSARTPRSLLAEVEKLEECLVGVALSSRLSGKFEGFDMPVLFAVVSSWVFLLRRLCEGPMLVHPADGQSLLGECRSLAVVFMVDEEEYCGNVYIFRISSLISRQTVTQAHTAGSKHKRESHQREANHSQTECLGRMFV